MKNTHAMRKKHARKAHNSLHKAGKTLSDGFLEESGKNLSDLLFHLPKFLCGLYIKVIEFSLIVQLSHGGSLSITFIPSAQNSDISRQIVEEIVADSE